MGTPETSLLPEYSKPAPTSSEANTCHHAVHFPRPFGICWSIPCSSRTGTRRAPAAQQPSMPAYVAFARDPEHGLATQDWQQYSRLGEDTVREFGAGVAAQDTSIGSTEDLCAF